MKFLNSLLVISVIGLCASGSFAQDAEKETAKVQQWESLRHEPNIVHTDLSKVGNIVHVKSGQSIYIDAPTELARVYVNNPANLSAFVVNPHQVLVSGKTPGLATLVISDSTGASSTYGVRIDVDVAPLQSAVESDFPMDRIHVESDAANVVLTGYVVSTDEYKAVDKLAESYGKTVFNSLRVAPPHSREVKLQVRFVEIDRSKMQQAAFNLLSLGKNIAMTGLSLSTPFQAPSISNGNGEQTISVNNPMNLLLYNTGLNLGAAIEDLESKNLLQILAEPTIYALSGHQASFISGGEFPYPMIQSGFGGQTSISVQFMPYGVRLNFEPSVLDDGTIRLHVAPEVSALDYSNEVNVAGYTIPAISERRAETYVELRSGQTFALSGLLDRQVTDSFQKMPGITSIPILGALFKAKSVQESTTDLLVLVTPTIIDPITMPQPAPDEPKPGLPYLDQQKFDTSINPKKKD